MKFSDKQFIKKLTKQVHMMGMLNGGHVPLHNVVEEKKDCYLLKFYLPSVPPATFSIEILDYYLVLYHTIKEQVLDVPFPRILQITRIPHTVNREKITAWCSGDWMMVSMPKYSERSRYHRQIATGD